MFTHILMTQLSITEAETHPNHQFATESHGGSKPLVSVVITTKNRSRFLREAVESVLSVERQGFDLEVIVVDDGSTDDTLEVLQAYPVKVLRLNGVGMVQARNAGLQKAQGSFVTLLDDDDVWMPNNIKLHLDLFRQHPEFGAVHAQSQLVLEDKTPFGQPVPEGPLRSGWIFKDLLSYFPQVGTILTRTEVAHEAGEMDPKLTGDTDWDWLLRIAKRHQIGTIEQPVLLFRQRDHAVEELSWRRFPAMAKIFHHHTRSLGLIERLSLQPILWRHRGAWASGFLRAAQTNYIHGDRKRAYRSMYYAFLCSPPHTVYNCLRSWPLRTPQSAKKHNVS
jgi:glycosyltransferase involved in cell wall biosynthesis